MSHLPKFPVRFLEANDALLKSMDAGQSHESTDYKVTENATDVTPGATYRAPGDDRVRGNTMFRRYPDGTLDVSYAEAQVVDVIHKVRDGIELNSMEQAVLSCCFPLNFSYVEPGLLASIREVNLKINEHEAQMVAAQVTRHLHAEIQYMLSCHAR